jgi:RNA polymerase sigma factor (TIGR02999 family)
MARFALTDASPPHPHPLSREGRGEKIVGLTVAKNWSFHPSPLAGEGVRGRFAIVPKKISPSFDSLFMPDDGHQSQPALRGDLAAADLLPLVYDELRMLAARDMVGERPGQTLNATALVHEAYLRLLGPEGQKQKWDGRAHFFGAAAQAMRRILVENARRKSRVKHGGGLQRVALDNAEPAVAPTPDEILALDEALNRFAVEEPEAARVVELRYFAGCSIDEAAEMLGISRATANRHWAYARAWLRCELEAGE